METKGTVQSKSKCYSKGYNIRWSWSLYSGSANGSANGSGNGSEMKWKRESKSKWI